MMSSVSWQERAVVLVLVLGIGLLASAGWVRGDQRGVPIKTQAGSQVGFYKESYALVIGVSDYTGGWPRLPGVKDDIQAVSRTLEKQGFHVVVVENPDQAALEKA